MAGFLDQKERVLDTIITQEGRKQLAAKGRLNPVFYSFSDTNCVYNMDTIVTGSSLYGIEVDETFRPNFESVSLPQDKIIFDVDNEGLINLTKAWSIDFFVNWQITVQHGEVFATNNTAGISLRGKEFFDLLEENLGEKVAYEQVVSNFFTQSFLSFQQQHILKSPDPIDLIEKTFKVSPSELTFQYSDKSPIENWSSQEADINHIETLIFDKKLSHQPAFEFLPPIYQEELGGELVVEQEFADLSQNKIEYWSDLKQTLDQLELKGMMSEIIFPETSQNNNLLGQIFEIKDSKIGKLDLIDFGIFKEDDVMRHVYFVGKLFRNNLDQTTFVNIFTLVFELGAL